MRRIIVCLVMLMCLAATGAIAQRVDISSRTYWLGYVERAYGGIADRVPMYEFVDLTARDLGVPGLNFYASGYGMLNLYQLGGEHRGWGDLETGFLEYQDPANRFNIKAGRLFLFNTGTFGDVVDGGSFEYNGPGGVTFKGFAGATVTEGFKDSADSYLFGGRLGDRLIWAAGMTDLGVSFVRRIEDGDVARELLGVDLTYYAPKYVNVGSEFLYDDITGKVQEISAQVGVHPHTNVDIGLDYQYVVPSLYLSKTSIFSVFADDGQNRVGLSISGQLGKWSLQGGFHYILFKSESNGYTTKAGFRYAFGKEGDFVGLDVGRYMDYQNGYLMGRAYASYKLPGWFDRKIRVTGDLQYHYFDDPMDGVSYSMYSAVSIGYKLPIGMDLSAVCRFRRDPYTTYDTSGELRLSYFFGAGGKK